MRISNVLIFLLGLSLATAAPAQNLQPPQVWIPPAPGNQPIQLDTVAIEVKMQGFLARTRIEMVFDNPNARVLEGEFVFPLGAGQTVTGYALEVDGTLREGVVVPKQTARMAFEETSRQQIDPGLAELTRGNVFRTRLYPIPAKGKKRIVLEFEQVMDDAGSHWRYLMPLQFREPVRHFSVKAEAPLDAPVPEIGIDSPDAQMAFTQAVSVWRAELVKEDFTPQSELAFRVPKKSSDATVLEARDRLEPAKRAVLARVDTGRPADLSAASAPQHIALFFDASGSAQDRDLARERAALKAWLTSLGEVTMDLVAVRDVAEPPRRFRIKKGNASALLQALEALPLDGASNYGAIDFSAAAKADLAMIVGDGLDTYGSGHTDFSKAPARVFVLHAAQRTDPIRLALLASHGGQVLDLTRINADQAVAALSSASWHLLAIESSGQCSDITPAAPTRVDSSLRLAARCIGQSTLKLRFGDADGHQTLVREISVGQAEPVTGPLADTVWRAVAQARITQLQAQPKPDTEAITHLAVQHGVVSTYTSLLVLDRIEDYVRYRVEPKEPELRERYQHLLATTPKLDAGQDRGAQIRSLAQRWQSFRDWHSQRHDWLETLLEPTAEAEYALWQQAHANDALTQKQLDARRKDLDTIRSQAKDLSRRWSQAGAEPGPRAAWEREAIAVMLRLDELREQRRVLLPNLAQVSIRSDEVADDFSPMSMPAPAPAYRTQQEAAPVLEAIVVETAEDSTAAGSSAKVAASSTTPALTPRIELTGWNPDTPYLKTLREARDAYAAYLELRQDNLTTPTFYLDVADYFRNEVKQPALALRILSNLAEIGDENTAVIRILGYRLVQWDHPELAVRPFEDALTQRPEEPQSHRDLALALARLDQAAMQRAASLLWQVATGSWSSRFAEVDLIALHELTALLAAHPEIDVSSLHIPAELLVPVEVGLRVVLTWDADNTDIDLHMIDPSEEEVYYSHRRSRSGGDLSRDFTQGYGPEVFTIARPLPGTYRVETKYYGDRRQSITGPVSVQVEFQTGFGSHEPTREATTRRLETTKERIEIGQFRVQPAATR